MTKNIIRQDIVAVDFDINFKEFQKLQNDLNDLKKKLSGDMGGDSFEKLKKQAKGATDGMDEANKSSKKLNDSLTTLGKKGANVAFNGLKKIAGLSFKALLTGAGAVAAGIGKITYESVQAYAEFEQLKGGVETLFGAKGAKSVEEYAKYTGKSVDKVKKEYDTLIKAQNSVLDNAGKAWLTTGLSQNDYMSTVTTFSASLIKSLNGDTTKAAELSDLALRDMADNANKMGTDISMIQSAYSGIARGNFMMLDNLKLGYAGSKSELERLLEDAEKIKAKMGETVDYDINSYADIIKAIHTVQENMGITGTTEKEALTTVTGSLNAMKASWENLLIAMGSGENLDECLDNMLKSAETFAGNALPVVEKALVGMGVLVERVAPMIEERLPELADKLLPPLIKATISLVKGLVKATPNIIKTLGSTLADVLGNEFPAIKSFGTMLEENGDKIAKFIPVLVGLVLAFKMFNGIKSITSLFGGKGGSSEGGGGIFGGITKTLTELAKVKPTVILKGMANMAIIMGGFTLMAAAFMLVAPLLAEINDMKAFAEMIVVIGVLGAVSIALAKFAEPVGKIPVSTVLKGLANMAIIMAGMSALFLLIGAVSLINFDLKRVLAIATIIGVIGIIGTALTLLGAVVGLIPVSVVALGLANIAIIIAGMSALFLLIGATSLIDFDLGRITKIIGIIGLLGLVGSVLTVFAGVVGLIPTPVILLGLANIALILGGLTALIIAFGALSKVDGLEEFITSGGELLVKLFGIIGKMSGALIGGIGEGVSEALPKIGKNLGKFGENMKPLFSCFEGADMSGVGTFFGSLGAFLLLVTGNSILDALTSWFTGGNDGFETIGTQLSTFAKNAKGFFETVAQYPEAGFTNATKFFECLGGIKNLPKEGGVVSWFTGNISYSNIAAGLGELSSENVVKFFKTVKDFEQAGFDNATALFDCLANMKSLPKEGGVKGWFSGEINYGNIAAGLGELSSDGVKKFFAMASGFNQKTFDNTTALFECLSNIGELPKEGGFWQNLGDSITGKETKSALSTIAADLENFEAKTQKFFAQVNTINLGNLNGLWDSLERADGMTAKISKNISKDIDDIVKKVSKLPVKMGEAIKLSGASLANSFVEVWKEAVKASVAPVNKLLDGANWVLKQFGSKKKVITWTPYAKGTSGHKGGNALVNDGNGAELVQMPNGNMFIPNGRNVLIPNAPQGMKVLPADRTAQLMGRKTPTFNYAKGIGDIDVWSYIDNSKGLVNKISDSVSYKNLSGFNKNLGKAVTSTFTGEMTSWVDKLFEESVQSISSYVASKGVNQWRPTVIRALKMEGQYSTANVARTLFQMRTESGGNPRAINLWDSNAKKGIPSKGLMQVIDPTFRAYARTGFDKNIYDPLSNVLASIRYAVSRYGSLARAFRGKGYENGGFANSPSVFGENGLEAAIPLRKDKRKRGLSLWAETGERLGVSYTPESTSGDTITSTRVENNNYSPQITINVNGTSDERSLTRKIKRVVKQAIDEVVDEIERDNQPIRET